MGGMTRLQQVLESRRAPDYQAVQVGLANAQGGAGSAPLPPLTRQVLPPWYTKLGVISTDFTIQSFADVAPAAVGQTVSAATFHLPGQHVGWVDIFGIYCQSPTNATSLVISLTINGAVVPGYSKQVPPGVANLFIQNFSGIAIRIPDGGQVGALISNLSGTGPFTCGAIIAGWYHPLNEEQRVFGDRY